MSSALGIIADATSAVNITVSAAALPNVTLPFNVVAPSARNVPYTLVLPVALATLNLVLAPLLTFKLLLIVVVPSAIV